MHVLVVQSHPGIQLGIAHLVRAFGFSVETANSIKEVGCKMVPDVLIADELSAAAYGFDNLNQLWQVLDPPPEVILTAGGGMTLDQPIHESRFKKLSQPLDANELEQTLEKIRQARE